MFKFIHAADIHLDSPLRGLEKYEGAPIENIRQATRKSLANLVQFALAEPVAFVIIAGDLFDGDLKDYSAGLFFARQMACLQEAGIQVFVISGNHDAVNNMTKTLRLPANVTMLTTEKPQTVLIDHLGVALHGQGFATREGKEVQVGAYPDAIKGHLNIGILHTCANENSGLHQRYVPCTLEELRSHGYDYWALGHIHQRRCLTDNPCVYFPGNLQGRHAKETGPKGCLLVTVSDTHIPAAEFKALDVLRWEHCNVDVTEAANEDDVLADVAANLASLRETSNGLPLAVRVEITGASPAHSKLHADPDRCVNQIRNAAIEVGVDRLWIEKIKLTTSPPHDEKRELDGPLAELHAVLEAFRRDEEKPRLNALLADLEKKLPKELKEKDSPEPFDITDSAWLWDVLDQVEPLLISRLAEVRADK
jgi:DNA repair protein SbcD/Mre11